MYLVPLPLIKNSGVLFLVMIRWCKLLNHMCTLTAKCAENIPHSVFTNFKGKFLFQIETRPAVVECIFITLIFNVVFDVFFGILCLISVKSYLMLWTISSLIQEWLGLLCLLRFHVCSLPPVFTVQSKLHFDQAANFQEYCSTFCHKIIIKLFSYRRSSVVSSGHQ